MPDPLLFHALDPAEFPELDREAGLYGFEVKLLEPARDPRIPAPADSPLVLLADYRLLAATVPLDAALRMTITGQRDRAPYQAVFDLVEPPPPGDNLAFARWDSSVPLPPGTVWQRIFWIDLGPLLEDARLLPGDTVTLGYGKATAKVRIP